MGCKGKQTVQGNGECNSCIELRFSWPLLINNHPQHCEAKAATLSATYRSTRSAIAALLIPSCEIDFCQLRNQFKLRRTTPMWRNGRRNGLKIRWAVNGPCRFESGHRHSENVIFIGKFSRFGLNDGCEQSRMETHELTVYLSSNLPRRRRFLGKHQNPSRR